MKALIIALLAVVLFSGTTAQSQIRTPDSADVYAFTIKKMSAGATIPFLAAPQVVKRAFGAPSSSVQEYGEMDDITFTKSDYGGLTIWFDQGRTAYLDIETTAYGLVYKNQIIKVGNNISTLGSLFPNSYAARANEQIHIQLHAAGVMTDARIVIRFNQSDKIRDISLAQ
ncbi:MAG TPA: hypothetical protein VGE15_13740 [Sphingobacteriaceae bacterium]